jgi:metal-responsive CopG/Arc/MetJ family transcriptional regulator
MSKSTRGVSVKLPVELVDRLDAYADGVNAAGERVSSSRGEIIRRLLERGLDGAGKAR